VASTTALPPPTCTARQEAGQLHRLAVLLQGLCRPDRLPAVFLLQSLCRPVHLPAVFACNGLPLPCHAYCPHPFLPPFYFAFPFPHPLFITMCARIVAQFARTALLAATTQACSGGRAPCLRPSIHPSIHPLCSLRASLELAWILHCAAHAPLCSLRPFLKGGRSWTACEQPATFPVTCIT